MSLEKVGESESSRGVLEEEEEVYKKGELRQIVVGEGVKK